MHISITCINNCHWPFADPPVGRVLVSRGVLHVRHDDLQWAPEPDSTHLRLYHAHIGKSIAMNSRAFKLTSLI